MTIYFIRHPKTEAPEGVCYGSTDVMPAPGQLEKVVQEALPKLNITDDATFISSPLSRCTMLASAFANGKEVKTDARIAELDFGKWEMAHWNAIPADAIKAWSADFVNNVPEGGESFAQVIARVRDFWKEIIQSDESTKIVTTHSGVLRALLVIILEASPYKVFNTDVEYGDVVRVEVNGDKYFKLRFL